MMFSKPLKWIRISKCNVYFPQSFYNLKLLCVYCALSARLDIHCIEYRINFKHLGEFLIMPLETLIPITSQENFEVNIKPHHLENYL